MHRFEQYLKILQLYHENSKVPTQFQILKRKRHSKALRRSEKMHPVRILRSKTKSTFLTISIPVAGTNSVSSGNILDEFFFDKYFAEKLKGSHDNFRAPDKLHICIFYAMKTSKNACIIRSECTHYAYILLCKQAFQIRSILVQSCT